MSRLTDDSTPSARTSSTSKGAETTGFNLFGGQNPIGALCVVAATLAERAWAVMNRQMPSSSATPTG